MALKSCPECKKEVSSEAKACPHCGKPLPKIADMMGSLGCFLTLFVTIPIIIFALAGGCGT